ncbi:MAG: metalloregulator ArsR/SmtB family transcription factor [Eubacterium sp.]|nr:metalloregulator ArsR/SmtB family transcription factor [Eubacterium sp.]
MKQIKCDCTPVHPDEINTALEKMPEITDIMDLADFFKVMGDSTRLKILLALIQGEFCVSDLSVMLNMSQSAISHQLKALKNAKLVRYRKEGRIVYYALDDDHIKDILDHSLIHVLDC